MEMLHFNQISIERIKNERIQVFRLEALGRVWNDGFVVGVVCLWLAVGDNTQPQGTQVMLAPIRPKKS